MPSDKQEVLAAGQALLQRVENVMEGVDWSSFLTLAQMLREVKRIFVTGAGRSGLVARMFGMRLMHAGLTAYVPGETITPAAGQGDLLVAISCTGATGYTDYLAQRAKQFGAKVVVITSEPDSALAKDADFVVHVPTTAEDIVTRAAVFEHAAGLCLDAVFDVISEKLKLDVAAFQSRHANLE
jgi:6-phospho-3-hexuloisomerase